MGGISKSGDAMTREMLFEAALVLMTHSRKWSWLKAWGMKIARHRGMKRAIVAVASQERRRGSRGKRTEYRLTPAGRMRWAFGAPRPNELSAHLACRAGVAGR